MRFPRSYPIVVVVVVVVAAMVGVDAVPTRPSLQNPAQASTSGFYAKKLYKDMLAGYNTRVHPRKNHSDSVEVKGRIHVRGIESLDFASQKMIIMMRFSYSWKDDFLTWDTRNYGGVNKMYVPMKDMWTPRMFIEDSFDGQGNIGAKDDVILVDFNGKASWEPKQRIGLKCDLDIQYYPFDHQTCYVNVIVKDNRLGSTHLVKDSDKRKKTAAATKDNYEWVWQAKCTSIP